MEQRPKSNLNSPQKKKVGDFLSSQNAQNVMLLSAWQPSFWLALPSCDSMGDPHMPQRDALFNILIRGLASINASYKVSQRITLGLFLTGWNEFVSEFTCMRRARMKSGQGDHKSQQYSISASNTGLWNTVMGFGLTCSDGFWYYLLPSCMRRTQILPPCILQTDTALAPTPGINTNREKYSTNPSLKHSWSLLLVLHLACFSLRHSVKESVGEVEVIKLSKISNGRGKRRDWPREIKKPDR